MVREISAGGVLIRKREGSWWMAVIEPAGEPAAAVQTEEVKTVGAETTVKAGKKAKPVLALPKGLVDAGEKPLEAALREVYEETGTTAEVINKLADTKYVYTRAWGDGQRVFKIVSFYLMRYRSGRIDDIAPEMRIEVARAFWIKLEEAPKLLAYRGEKQMAQLALKYLEEHPEI
jgi:8-oxo-dGTP pyrophosphatase MutT (NUDIX family)